MKSLAITALLAALACVSQAQAAPLTTQDYIDIEQLYATYNTAIDAGDAEGWAATFTPDGSFLNFNGKDALVGFVKRWHGSMGGATRRHWNTNLKITPTAEGAAGTVYLMLVDVSSKSIYSTAMYTDTLVKTAEGWRFKKRMLKTDAPAAAAPAAATTPSPPPAVEIKK